MNYQNHVIDPTFFYDAIDEFSFDYNLYVNTSVTVNNLGKRILQYELKIIKGSLQSQGKSIDRNITGNTITHEYKFYCKSLYRIDIDNILEYKNNYYIVTSIQDYDEFGVREATLNEIQLTSYRDLKDYIKYLQGEKIV